MGAALVDGGLLEVLGGLTQVELGPGVALGAALLVDIRQKLLERSFSTRGPSWVHVATVRT